MRIKVAGLLMALALLGCSPEPTQSTPAQPQPSPTQAITESQMQSITALRLGDVDEFREFTDQEIAWMFHQQCQALNNGRDIGDAMVDSQAGTEMGFRLIGAAVASTCPEHIPALEEYSYEN